MSPDPALESALREWQLWPVANEPKLVRQFDAGLNHKTALIETGDRYLVLKVFTSGSENALAAQRWAADINISPGLLFESENGHYCLMEYIGDSSLAGRAVHSSELRAVARSLQAMHSEPAGSLAKTAGEFDIFYWCNQYLPVAGIAAMQIHQSLSSLLSAYESDATQRCFCHNDLVAENCFLHDGHALFIDWEFAQWHNPWFDLASIIYYLKLDTAQSRAFLNCYKRGWGEKAEDTIFVSSQIALLWGDMLWHLAKFGDSFWPSLSDKMRDLRHLARQLDTELPTPHTSI